MDKKQKMIFWDFGNVIARFSVDSFLENLASLFHTSPFVITSFMEGEFADTFGVKQFWHAIEGDQRWTQRRIYEEFVSHFGEQPFFDSFIDAFNSPLVDDGGHGKRFLAFSRRIQDAGYYQGLISNANSIHSARMENELGYLLSYIPKEYRYYSWQLGVRKNEDPKIFHVVFTAIKYILKIDRENIVFIDDRPENIKGCRKAGAKAIEFNIGDGLYRLEDKLKKIGFSL